MSKIDFMKELESLLSDIPSDEKEEALQYYADYFEDAGEENEEAIIGELGSPARVASIIKAELGGNSSECNRGVFTEKGYQDTILPDEKYEIVGSERQEEDEAPAGKARMKPEESTSLEVSKISNDQAKNQDGARYRNPQGEHQANDGYRNSQGDYRANNGYSRSQGGQQANDGYHNSQSGQRANNGYNGSQSGQQADDGYRRQQESYKKNTNIGLIILLCILAIPVGLPVLATIFGITVALLATIFALFIGFGAAGLALMGVGVALVIAGIIKLGIPFIGFVLCGVGLLSLGLGMLLVMLTGFIGKTVFPAIVRGIVNICRLPFKNRSVTA
ncbi:MAG: DUF1700 domain-containing protein [Lachnospiraceae bacterium]|jgi:uncharacterized membrane protein|nr:DUF1700 domain-containing protein [Lachnospiraceae bacterium]